MSTDKQTEVRSTVEALSTFRALKLALEALEDISSHYMSLPKKGCMALAAIEEALAEQETVLPGGGHVPAVPVAVYGYCPECGGAGVMRERRPNGDDKCTNGHKYPSSKALAEQPTQQEPVTIGEPVGWHSKQYGFVYMALQPHQFEVGSTLCLKNGTPAWRIESSCSMTALISMSSLPHGTVFYTSPPAQRKPLDASEISRLWKRHTNEDGQHAMPHEDDGLGFARAIEAAHGIKGDA